MKEAVQKTIHRMTAHLPHVGMRRVKSLLALVLGFLSWQLVRLVFPDLEVHPFFIYMYGLLEIRDSSAATVHDGRAQIKVTMLALPVGLAAFSLSEIAKYYIPLDWAHTIVELVMLLLAVLVMFIVAEKGGCKENSGLAVTIVIVLMVSSGSGRVLYAVLRGVQTVMGVFIAWLINVKLLPYPGKPHPEEESKPAPRPGDRPADPPAPEPQTEQTGNTRGRQKAKGKARGKPRKKKGNTD